MSSAKHKTKDDTAVVQVNAAGVPVAYDYSAYAGAGFESHTKEDYAVPFLGVLQTNSPLITNDAEARPGMLVNTVTNELFDAKKGISFIPAETQHVFVEWIPRDQGGGFVAVHQLDSEIVNKVKAEQEFGKYKVQKGDPKSNDLIETYYVYGILVKEDGSSEQLIIAFTSTKNKIYRQWMTKARTVQIPLPDGRRVSAPLFAHKYRITSVSQKNTMGSFFNFQVGFDGKDAESCRLSPADPLFLAAVDFRELVKGDGVKAAHDSQTPGNAPAEEEDTATPFK
jgi:hypothetical protein